MREPPFSDFETSKTSRDPVSSLRVKFWGVCGSFPRLVPPDDLTDRLAAAISHLRDEANISSLAELGQSPSETRAAIERLLPFHLRSTFGTHTTCVEIESDDALIILDAGSGLLSLGMDLSARWNSDESKSRREAHIILSHCHFDHLMGLPYAAPLFDPKNEITIWASQRTLDAVDSLLNTDAKLKGTFFPTSFEMFPGLKECRQLEAGQSLSFGETNVSTLSLNHPGDAMAFCFTRDGNKFAFVSDHEPENVPDERIAEFVSRAQLLYLDSQYQLDEYAGKTPVGKEPATSREKWGHGWCEAAIETASVAQVDHLLLGHHDPLRSDVALQQLLDRSRLYLANNSAQLAHANYPRRIDLAAEGREFLI